MPARPGLRPDPAASDSARVFFALWPDEPIRARLAREAELQHATYGGRRMRPDGLHVTLLFIGKLARARLPALQAAAAGLDLPGFTVHFEHVACWHPKHIVCLGTGDTPPAMLALVAGLEQAASALAIPFDRRDYTAHVTLLRNARCGEVVRPWGLSPGAQVLAEPIAWLARDFVLLESSLEAQGARYRVIERFPLGR